MCLDKVRRPTPVASTIMIDVKIFPLFLCLISLVLIYFACFGIHFFPVFSLSCARPHNLNCLTEDFGCIFSSRP